MVDDKFLCDGDRMVFAQCKNDEIWVPLIEKAWAKLLGSYTRIDRAFLECEALHTLTGSPSKYINHADLRNDKTKKNKHWEAMKSAD
jgi:calpain-15